MKNRIKMMTKKMVVMMMGHIMTMNLVSSVDLYSKYVIIVFLFLFSLATSPNVKRASTPVLAPPLPLMDFDRCWLRASIMHTIYNNLYCLSHYNRDSICYPANTITGVQLPIVDHIDSDSLEGSPLHNPLHSK